MHFRDVPNFYLPTTFAPATTHVAGVPIHWEKGLQHALLDQEALFSLETLVSGPVTNWEVLESAEQAIRAFVLHGQVDCLLPAILLTIRQKGGGLTVTKYAWRQEADATLPLIREVNLFARPLFIEWISARSGHILESDSYWHSHAAGLLATGHELLPSLEEYAKQSDLLAALAATPAALGAPSYFGVGSLRQAEDELVRGRAPLGLEAYLATIDAAWRDRLRHLLVAGIELRLGPFLHVVLQRASSRTEIVEVILDLRRDFDGARVDLWEIFEQFRTETDSKKLVAKAESVTRSAQSVIPSAFPQDVGAIRLLFGLGTILTGALGGLLDALRELAGREAVRSAAASVDAGRLLARHLKMAGPDFTSSLRKHLTTEELASLGLP